MASDAILTFEGSGINAKTAFGDPYHGLTEGGFVTLPNGKTRKKTQPSGEGTVLPIQIPDFPLLDRTGRLEADVTNGWEWRNYALLSGKGHQLYGKNLGENAWIFIDGAKKPWLVKLKDSGYEFGENQGLPNLQRPVYNDMVITVSVTPFGIFPTPYSKVRSRDIEARTSANGFINHNLEATGPNEPGFSEVYGYWSSSNKIRTTSKTGRKATFWVDAIQHVGSFVYIDGTYPVSPLPLVIFEIILSGTGDLREGSIGVGISAEVSCIATIKECEYVTQTSQIFSGTLYQLFPGNADVNIITPYAPFFNGPAATWSAGGVSAPSSTQTTSTETITNALYDENEEAVLVKIRSVRVEQWTDSGSQAVSSGRDEDGNYTITAIIGAAFTDTTTTTVYVGDVVLDSVVASLNSTVSGGWSRGRAGGVDYLDPGSFATNMSYSIGDFLVSNSHGNSGPAIGYSGNPYDGLFFVTGSPGHIYATPCVTFLHGVGSNVYYNVFQIYQPCMNAVSTYRFNGRYAGRVSNPIDSNLTTYFLDNVSYKVGKIAYINKEGEVTIDENVDEYFETTQRAFNWYSPTLPNPIQFPFPAAKYSGYVPVVHRRATYFSVQPMTGQIARGKDSPVHWV